MFTTLRLVALAGLLAVLLIAGLAGIYFRGEMAALIRELSAYTDVSAQWDRLRVLQWAVVGSVAAVLGLLIALLITVYRRAELLIARQYERNIELEAAAASAQEETREKTQFITNISHELRTPLNAIIGFSEVMKNEMVGRVPDPRFEGFVGDIHSAGVHLLSLINDILEFSKAEAGRLELEIEDVNASKMVANSLRLMQPRAQEGRVELINLLPKEPIVLETDGKKLKQVLLNILSNAVKFTPARGEVAVRAWHDIATDIYIFQVVDTGIGMASKDIAKAMALFGQVDNTLSRRYEGTGLGLPLTRKFVELMGGRFSIQSEQQRGTTVTFSLPRQFHSREGVAFRKIG